MDPLDGEVRDGDLTVGQLSLYTSSVHHVPHSQIIAFIYCVNDKTLWLVDNMWSVLSQYVKLQ